MLDFFGVGCLVVASLTDYNCLSALLPATFVNPYAFGFAAGASRVEALKASVASEARLVISGTRPRKRAIKAVVF